MEKEICKVTWCKNQSMKYKNGRPRTYCLTHVNRPGNANSRPWLFYKAERIAGGKLECEKCGDNLQKRFPHRKLKDVIQGMDVDHIVKPTEWDIKNNPWYNVKTKKIEHPDNYQLICKYCHLFKSIDEGDFKNNKYKNNNMGM